eukprot:CAMPEP_0119479574 /NCGR_PEP_ID=MMETSP1344-20130328/8780_1 /TAXON_ID=236787 /ORGANISM="Florenciella parvula, Strain CCMP2471" /LENGTH=30 /DNA_ID= /DNA_START= /DNA_END= /DNA_ORIENTATION=
MAAMAPPSDSEVPPAYAFDCEFIQVKTKNR